MEAQINIANSTQLYIPKILIIGESFHTTSGGGITLTKLMKNWPMDRVAIAGSPKTINKMNNLKPLYIYQFGFKEFYLRFPFSLLTTKYQSKIIAPSFKTSNNSASKASPDTVIKKKSMKLFLKITHFWGIYHIVNQYSITSDFLDWVKEFNPDYIYSQLSTLPLIRLVDHLRVDLNKKVAIHFMDDWPKSINKKGILKIYWDKKIDIHLRNLLDHTSIRLAISEKMANKYQKRYGNKWSYFHNPVEVERWKSKQITKLPKGVLNILYAGRIGLANEKSIKLMVEALREIKLSTWKVNFHIISPNYESYLHLANETCKVLKPVPYDEIPALWTKYDLLYLPQDFDKRSIDFIRYSIPAKLTEYMISGVPILIHAPEETALYHFATEYNVAFMNSVNRKSAIIGKIEEILNNEDKYVSISKKAIEIATTKHSTTVVQNDFLKMFQKDFYGASILDTTD